MAECEAGVNWPGSVETLANDKVADEAAAAASPMLDVLDLKKDYHPRRSGGGTVAALRSVSFLVGEGEFFTLLGPSGCGKTTTLRCIAGLEVPSSGSIIVAGRDLYSSSKAVNVRPNRRGLAMVFQSYAIWPHMNVHQNVAFPLGNRKEGRRRLPSAEVARRVGEALEKVELVGYGKRRATELSGGQQQRLALARALVMEAPLTLFDEPLSNLDAKLRESMRFELKRLQRELGITAIYVTHDQSEALAMSSRIAVMRDGVIEQVGRPRELYERPCSLFVADFLGTSNFLNGKVQERVPGTDSEYVVATAGGCLSAQAADSRKISAGMDVTVSVRPQHLAIEEGTGVLSGVGQLRGVVRSRAYLGEYVDHVVDANGVEIRVRGDSGRSVRPGTEVSVRMEASACRFFAE